MMTTRMLLTAGAALLALAACSRRDQTNTSTSLGIQTNEQTGVITTPQGLQANGLGAASECLSPEDMRRPASDFTPDQRRQMIGCLNASLARQVNPQLPRLLDSITRLDRLTTEGPQLTYHYTILRAASSLPAGAAQQVETTMRRMACSQPQARQTIEMGGAYAYRYVDNQGVLFHQFRIDAC
jgi:hypothetical protein